MGKLESRIEGYRKKMQNCTSMTDLLVAMASWQSFADSNGLSKEQRKEVDDAYLKAEAVLLAGVSKTPW